MKSHLKFITVLFFFTLLFSIKSNYALCQDRKGNYGIGIIVSDLSQDLLFKYWISPSFCIQPAIGLSVYSPKEGTTASNYRIGIGFLGYGSGKLSSYYGVRFGSNILAGGGETNSDILIAAVFGAEYFFSENFSIGGEFQAVVGIADDDFSPTGFKFGSTNYNTGALATFNFYFK